MDAADWDDRYRGSDLVWSAAPNAEIVRLVEAFAPAPGRALDIACGEGRNAVWLAERGWHVTGTDFSAVALDRARQVADERGVSASWLEVDVVATPPDPLAFDLVLIAYLQLPAEPLRWVVARAADAVAPGGVLVMVGHDRANVAHGHGGPPRPEVNWDLAEITPAIDGLDLLHVGRCHRSVGGQQAQVAIDAVVVAGRDGAAAGSTWGPELTELRRRGAYGRRMGGRSRVARQHRRGRMTVRERIAALAEPGSFREVGALAGTATYDDDGRLDGFRAANFVFGEARLATEAGPRHVVLAADDFTIRGGAADAAIAAKQVTAEQLAGERRIPIVRLVDGTGGGGSVTSLLSAERTYVPFNPGWDKVVANLGQVPVVAAALGPVAGLGAARVVSSHFSVMVRGAAQIFVAGPPVVKAGMHEDVSAEELGGAAVAVPAGTIDNLAADEAEAFAQIRRFLGYLPPSVWALPPHVPATDDADRTDPTLRDLVPRDRRRPYDVRALLDSVTDRGSLFELAAGYGRSSVTALARLDGFPVAIIAGDPTVLGAGLTGAAADKLTRFIDLADTFHLPVVHFVDQPGMVIGTRAEREATLRRGARTVAAVYQADVPWASVIVRRVFGVAGAGHRDHTRADLRVAWPSGDWGSLPVEGGIEAAYRRDLAAADDPDALRAELLARMEAVRSPLRTAESFWIDDIIDPATTRGLLCEWARGAYATLGTRRLGPRGRALRP